MRRLSKKQVDEQKLITKSVDNYFGFACPVRHQLSKKAIVLWLMNKRMGIRLNDEQKEAIEKIKNNLAEPHSIGFRERL